jgi:hypothetical protein
MSSGAVLASPDLAAADLAPRELIAPPVVRPRWWRQPTVVLVAVLAVLNLADLVTTRMVLDRGGSEGNPVMRPFVDGMWGAALIKFACLALIATLAARCLGSVKVRRGLVLVDTWYLVVVAWNLAVLARA